MRLGSLELEARFEQVVLRYHAEQPDRTWKHTEQLISIVFSSCHFGGRRPWFVCPGCRQKVGILYAASRFRCRGCLNLGYQSQR